MLLDKESAEHPTLPFPVRGRWPSFIHNMTFTPEFEIEIWNADWNLHSTPSLFDSGNSRLVDQIIPND